MEYSSQTFYNIIWKGQARTKTSKAFVLQYLLSIILILRKIKIIISQIFLVKLLLVFLGQSLPKS